MKKEIILVASFLVGGLCAQAQTKTWDPDGNSINDGGAGTWDLTTGNWMTGTTWLNGNNAVFGDSGGNYTVDLGTGVTVGDLTYAGTSKLQLKSIVDNTALTLSGDAAWNTGGGEIEFLNDTVNDTALNLAGHTLTVNGGGVFDTGEKGNNANWGAGNLVFTEATTVRGGYFSLGVLSSITLAGGSTFINERNSNQSFNSDFVLNGDVTFGNRYNRISYLNNVVGGTGRLIYADGGNTASFLRLNDTGNTFSGGIMSDGTASTTSIQLNGTDAILGGSAGADAIILKNGGYIEVANMGTLGATRGITLDGGGGIIAAHALTVNSAITGTGDLEVGEAARGANTLTLNSATSDFTGGTLITKGTLALGVADALPSSTVVSIGGTGGGTSALELNGKNLEIAGLASVGSNTKVIQNNGGAASTLTLNVGAGESYSYSGNHSSADAINIVKTGGGTQTFYRPAGFSTDFGTVAVNDGVLVWDALGGGDTTVGIGGTLGGSGTLDGAVTVGGNLMPGNSPGTLTLNNTLTLESTATLTIEITGTGAGTFDVLLNDGGDTLTAGGTLVLDTTGFTPVQDDTFTVFENWGGFAGNFDSISGTDLGGGLSFDTSNLLVDGTLMVVPEPGTLGLIVAMGGGLIWIRRVFMV